MAPIASVGDRSIPLEDDSGTIQTTPRRALISALTRAVSDGLALGDLELTKLAGELLVRLVRGWVSRAK